MGPPKSHPLRLAGCIIIRLSLGCKEEALTANNESGMALAGFSMSGDGHPPRGDRTGRVSRWTAEQKPTPETNQNIIDSLVRRAQVSRPEAALVLMAPEWALEREPVPEALPLALGSALGRALLLRRTLLLDRRKHRSW